MPRKVLLLQLAVIGACFVAITGLLWSFPYPSPFISPLLPPQQRWPSAEIRHWVEVGSYDNSFLEFFSRDPDRSIPPGNNLVSPADGMLQDVEYRDGKTYVVVSLSFWDVHVVRAPFAGVVKSIVEEGAFVTRDEPKQELHEEFFLRGKDAPVQADVTLLTDRGEMTVRLITSYWASRLKVWVHAGQKLKKGQRIGRILLGSTVVLELPGRVHISQPCRTHVTGGETLLWNAGDV